MEEEGGAGLDEERHSVVRVAHDRDPRLYTLVEAVKSKTNQLIPVKTILLSPAAADSQSESRFTVCDGNQSTNNGIRWCRTSRFLLLASLSIMTVRILATPVRWALSNPHRLNLLNSSLEDLERIGLGRHLDMVIVGGDVVGEGAVGFGGGAEAGGGFGGGERVLSWAAGGVVLMAADAATIGFQACFNLPEALSDLS